MSRVDSPRGLIVVTGGSRGIGAAIARSFAQAGHPVVITFSTNQQAANAFVQDQQREGSAYTRSRLIWPMKAGF